MKLENFPGARRYPQVRTAWGRQGNEVLAEQEERWQSRPSEVAVRAVARADKSQPPLGSPRTGPEGKEIA